MAKTGPEKVANSVPTGRVIKYPTKCALFGLPAGPAGPGGLATPLPGGWSRPRSWGGPGRLPGAPPAAAGLAGQVAYIGGSCMSGSLRSPDYPDLPGSHRFAMSCRFAPSINARSHAFACIAMMMAMMSMMVDALMAMMSMMVDACRCVVLHCIDVDDVDDGR